jgi:hypothetical protein
MYQSAEKRVTAVTANNGPGSTFFGSAYQAKRIRSRMIFCPVLPRVSQCGRNDQASSGDANRNLEAGSSHPLRIKIKIIP